MCGAIKNVFARSTLTPYNVSGEWKRRLAYDIIMTKNHDERSYNENYLNGYLYTLFLDFSLLGVDKDGDDILWSRWRRTQFTAFPQFVYWWIQWVIYGFLQRVFSFHKARKRFSFVELSVLAGARACERVHSVWCEYQLKTTWSLPATEYFINIFL